MPIKDVAKRRKYHNEYNKAWYKKQRALNPQKLKDYYKKYKEADPIKRLLSSTKQSARIKGIEHNIDESDLKCPDICPYLGIQIDYTAGNGKNMSKPSVDRIDPTKGYIKGNVEVISSLANTMKCNASPDLLVSFAKEVLNRYD